MSGKWGTPRERFFRYVKKTRSCWLWTGALHSSKGYGSFNGPGRKAHRASWIIHHGKIPKNIHVLHACDNTGCVNPKHLFLGTNQDNVDDRVTKNRNAEAKGAANANAKLTETDVMKIRSDTRPKKEIALEYGVHWKTISRVQLRHRWKDI